MFLHQQTDCGMSDRGSVETMQCSEDKPMSVTLLVGPERVTFEVAKDILCTPERYETVSQPSWELRASWDLG